MRIGYMDGLRAIAVLSVVAYHAAELSPAQKWQGLGGLLLRQGCHGVELFFVISGFCLSYPVLVRLRDASAFKFDLAAFGARRIVRIVPPYYAALVLLTLFAWFLERAHVAFPVSIVPGSVSLTDFARQAAFLDSGAHFVNTSFWTLAVELRWYLVFPIALWLWVRSPRAFGVMAIAALLAYATRAGSIDLLVLPAFMLGIVAAHMRINGSRFSRFAPAAFVPVAAMVLLQTPHEWGFVSPFSEAAAFLFVVGAPEIAAFARLLSCKTLALIGTASYSIYLVHSPLMGVLEEFRISPVIAAFAGVACGIAFWYVAERPFVETPLRDALIAKFAFLKSWMRTADLESGIALERQTA